MASDDSAGSGRGTGARSTWPPGPRSEQRLERIERQVARVVLVDEEDAVLLLSARDPRRPDGPHVWFTPGGGAERGETLEEAARREVYEETGARIGPVGRPVAERLAEFRFDDRQFVQHESYFVVRTVRFEVRPAALTELEARSTTGWRWWPAEELATTSAVVYPSTFATLLAEWLEPG